MMLKAIKISLACVFILIASHLSAQTLTPMVVASTGGTGSGTWGSLSYTGGEAVTETGVISVVSLTQGFHQPFVKKGSWVKKISLKDVFDVYPNPASQYVNIETSFTKGEIKLYNQVGQLLYYSDHLPQKIAVDQYAEGLYQIVISSDKVLISKSLLIF